MIPDWRRYLPLAVLVVAMGFLVAYSQLSDKETLPEVVAPHFEKRVPMPVYVLPADWHNPFAPTTEETEAPNFQDRFKPTSGPAKSVVHGKAAGGKSKGAESEAQAPLDINGIIWDPDKPMVSIDGHILPEGGHIGNIAVISILPDRVVLWVSGKRVVKQLPTVR
jgi:hypothetical protein